jgi:Copper acquisition factor BIM1-like
MILAIYITSFILLFGRPSRSHFLLHYPTSLGFDDNNEDSSPCGGFFVTFTNASDYHVGGDSIALTTLHPQSNFLFRGTLDATASGNWTNLFPVIGEYGLGAFCEASVATPAAWAGSRGVIQAIQNAEDGVHYQVRYCFPSIMTAEVNE